MVTFPYNTTDFAFTLEENYLSFSTTLTDTFFDLQLTILYFDFFSDTEKTKVLEYKIPLFNKSQTYNVGRKIHRYLSSLSTYNSGSGFQYKVAKVSFLIKEITIADDTVQDTITLDDVRFVAGPKPTLFSNNIALLSLNTGLEKVTNKSIFNISFLLTAGAHDVEVYKNNTIEASETITATIENAIYLKQLDLASLSSKIGDVFKIKIKNTSIQKEIVVGKKEVQFNQLVFLDAFKLPRTVSFSGEFSYKNKYNQISHEYKRNLEEVLEVITTEKVKSLIINTGNILKSERSLFDEINDSKKAMLISNNQVVLDLVPIPKELELQNSANENHSYKIEFQINKEYA